MSKEKPENPDWETVGMSPQAKRHYEDFARRIRDDLQEAVSTSLVVLVWGPGPAAGGDLFKKRQEIRGRLRLRGDVALFSEELDDICREFSASSRVGELFQAHRADFIVALYSSPGSIAEIHDMALALGSKMLIFIDSRHTQGYGFTGLLAELKSNFGNVETFEYPKDINECHLMTAIEEKLKKLRMAKWWAGRIGVRL